MAFYAFEFTIRQIPFLMIVGIFRSGGDTLTGVKYDLLTLWGLSIPATLIAVYVFNAPFIVAFAVMYIFEDYIKSILCIKYYKSMKWIKPVTEEGQLGLSKYLIEKDICAKRAPMRDAMSGGDEVRGRRRAAIGRSQASYRTPFGL